MKRRIIVTLAAGLFATPGCGGSTQTANPPPSERLDTDEPATAGTEGDAPDGAGTDGDEGAPPPEARLPEATDGPTSAPELISTNPPPVMPSKPKPLMLPAWDAVPSRHPMGATNPPSPVLIVGEDGQCFKKWVGGLAANRDALTPRVETCVQTAPDSPDSDCGTAILCPPEAADIMAAHQAKNGATSE